MPEELNTALLRTSSSSRPKSGRLRLGIESIRTPAAAYDEACLGRYAAAWYLVGYMGPLVVLAPLLFRHVIPGSLIVLVIPLAFVGLAAVLLVAISRSQARWACVVLLIWALYECLKTGTPLLRGQFQFALLANVVCLVIALRAARGAFALARMKRQAISAIKSFD